jgi:DNA polymerase-3 subunit delta'
MSETVLPEPDRVAGAPHPRHTARLVGQEKAEAAFLDAVAGGRLPHAWLLTGPKGVGKASFAWRVARYLLATPPPGEDGGGLFGDAAPDSLDISPDHPVAARLAALSEPGLLLLRRGPRDDGKALSPVIRIDEVRRLKAFFGLSAGGNGRRVVILDSADEMTTGAANALLKELEEPPRNSTLLLISHRPSGLLPTIRSRCRVLRFEPLGPADLAQALRQAGQEPGADAEALAALSAGSVGDAFELLSQDGLALYRDLLALLASLPRFDRPLAIRLSDATAGKGGEARFDLTLRLLDVLLWRAARIGLQAQAASDEIVPGESETLRRLAPEPAQARAWADLAATLTARARRGKAVNLDPAALTFDMFLDLDRVAARLPA